MSKTKKDQTQYEEEKDEVSEPQEKDEVSEPQEKDEVTEPQLSKFEEGEDHGLAINPLDELIERLVKKIDSGRMTDDDELLKFVQELIELFQ